MKFPKWPDLSIFPDFPDLPEMPSAEEWIKASNPSNPERDLWERCVIACLNRADPDMSPAYAVKCADDVLSDWRKRWKLAGTDSRSSQDSKKEGEGAK